MWLFPRLLLLMAMGLGALYMMHLLAQDYDKIRQPVAAAARALVSFSANGNLKALRPKRDTSSLGARLTHTHTNKRSTAQQRRDLLTQTQSNAVAIATNTSVDINWKLILSRDPFECLQSLICQLMSGAEPHSSETTILLNFLESAVYRAPPKVADAYNRGLLFRGHTTRCYDAYPFCVYSAKTMLRVLKWFADTPYVEEDAN